MKIDEAISKYRNRVEQYKDWENMKDIAEEHEQLAEWLEELKALREYKDKMEMQYLDDMNNPLEPLKLKCALESEIFKYNYRKEHKPQEINTLDYTVMYALKHCLDEQLKGGGIDGN